MPTASQQQLIIDNIRGVPDFPKKGILFWDITTLCLNPVAFKQCIDLFVERYKGKQIDVVAGELCCIAVHTWEMHLPCLLKHQVTVPHWSTFYCYTAALHGVGFGLSLAVQAGCWQCRF